MKSFPRYALFSMGAFGFLGLGIFLGQTNVKTISAQVPQPPAQQQPTPRSKADLDRKEEPPNYNLLENDVKKRYVASIYGTTLLTREDFGEYLIQRGGSEKIELFVNKSIIEKRAKEEGIVVTPEEVQASILQFCKDQKITLSDLGKMLKSKNLTYFEWKEDRERIRLIMEKMCKNQIQIQDEDLRKEFENQFGRKVKAQVIIWPRSDAHYLRNAQKAYEIIRKSDADFNSIAKKQADPYLASCEGNVKPISRWSPTGDNTMEDEAFKLKPGELSKILDINIGAVVVKCLGHVEADVSADFEKVKPDLIREVVDRKVSQEISRLGAKLKAEAKPVFFLAPKQSNVRDVDREVEEELKKVKKAGNSPMTK